VSHNTVDNAIDAWWKKLHACVAEKGGHLNTCCSNVRGTHTGCADKLDVVLDCTTVMCNFG